MRSLKNAVGFSLLEMTIGLLLLSLVGVFLSRMFSLSNQLSAPRIEDGNQMNIQEAFDAYLRVNLYLPCPDTDADGRENRKMLNGIAVCQSREGGLPYLDLQLSARDAWNNPYYYRVHQRAESALYINQICETSSVFGRSGARGIEDLWFCPSSHQFYCADHAAALSCDDVCSQACVNSFDPRPMPFAAVGEDSFAPYFHLNTPPFGTRVGSYNLILEDSDGAKVEEGVIAVVISWGKNGATVNWSSCQTTLHSEQENCNGDRRFVYNPSGENQDYIQWITVNQAKMALIKRGAFE